VRAASRDRPARRAPRAPRGPPLPHPGQTGHPDAARASRRPSAV